MIQSGHSVFLPTLDSPRPVRLEALCDTAGRPQQHDEAFLRDLVHRAPGVLPISEIEPLFEDARSICIELPNPAGFVDNLLVTPEGGIVLVECKLQRNFQARREVIAQIMDYASQLQSWTFEDLDQAVRRAKLPGKGSPSPTGLVEAFDNQDDFEPMAFRDAITRNLRRGRILLLIVGDGVREGLESLVGILQRHPGFHAALGLIELKLYRLPEGGFIVQPRTLLRTLSIERGVVTFSDDRLSIVQPAVKSGDRASIPGKTARPSSLTEDNFYFVLEQVNAEWPGHMKDLVERLMEIGLTTEVTQSLMVKWTGADGRLHNVITFGKDGRVRLDPLLWGKSEAERAAATAFRERIAQACGGIVRGETPNGQNIYISDRMMTIAAFFGHEEACIEAVQMLLRQLQELEQSQDRRL